MNNSQGQIDTPNGPAPVQAQKAVRNVSMSEAFTIIAGSLVTAIMYSLCFTGANVHPRLAFFVFCCGTALVLYAITGRLQYLVNKKAFRWAVPILIIASFNGIFQLNFFSYTNVIMNHILFAVLGFAAVQGKNLRFSETAGWFDILRVCCGNFDASLDIYRSMIKKRWGNASDVIIKVLLGTIIAVPVLVVVMLFLLDADAVFKSIVTDMYAVVAERNLYFLGHIACIVIVSVYLSGYVYNLKHMKECNGLAMPAKKLDTIIGVTFLGLINLVFLFFCVVQVAFLFAGGYMELPDGIVYSAYAREGFFQLLFVTIINFGVITVLLKLFPSCVQQKSIKTLLIMLSVFTGILICSSFYRMGLYISAYGYTDIRMMVITFLAMETVCVVVTISYILKPSFDFFKKYMYIGLVFYILVNVTSSNFFIASLNINRFYKGAGLDVSQFYRNPDSAPLLIEVVNTEIFHKNASTDDIEQANKIIADYHGYKESRWQNWSLLQSIGQVKLK